MSFGDILSASIITRYGRHFLEKAKRFFISQFPNSKCLYGDTDSLFISTGDKYSSKHLVQAYNSKHPLKLEIEAEFQKLILVRKKLYLGKLINNQGYKFSGFPKTLPKKLNLLMTNILKEILDSTSLDKICNLIGLFLKEARENYHHPSEYYLLRNPFSKTPVFKILPFFQTEKNNSNCVDKNNYNPLYHLIDEKATILSYLKSTFNPLFTKILKYPSLSYILDREIDTTSYYPSIIAKYISDGYIPLHFVSSYKLFSSIKFNKIYFENPQIQTLWEKDKNRNLSLHLTFNELGYVTVDELLYIESPKFYNLNDLEMALNAVFEYDKNAILKNHLNIIFSIDKTNLPSLVIFSRFLCFIYGQKFNLEEEIRLKESSTKILFILHDKELILINGKDIITFP